MTNSLAAMAAIVEETQAVNASLEERVSDLAMRLDTIGWEPATGWSNDGGMDLEALKATSAVLQDMAATSPLIKHAAELRHGYVFGRGINWGNLQPRHITMMEDPYNTDVLFSSQAQEELMKIRLTDGNIFLLYRKSDKQFFRVPLSEISGAVTDPNSSERVWFLKRTWNSYDTGGRSSRREEWYPVSKYTGPRRTTINKVSVNNDYIMFFSAFNRQVGWTFGIPDGYAAIVWTKAYSEYLKNNSKLVRAYATIAYKASTTKKDVGASAAVQMVAPGSVAGTAAMGPNTDLVPMPRAGSDVSFENGRPLASMVAAALGVSVVALLSDPGAAGSSYGSAQTLDAPTINGMSAIQRSWVLFYKEIFRNLKGADVAVEFPSIENDQAYRQIQSLQAAYQTGAIHQDEYRAGVLDILDIEPLRTSVPKPDKFNLGHLTPDEVAKNAQAAAELTAQSTTQAGSDQGQTNNDNRTDTQTTGDNG